MYRHVRNGNVLRVYAPLAQLDRVFGYEPKGRGFESLTACQKRGRCKSICLFFDSPLEKGFEVAKKQSGELFFCVD